MIHIKNKYLTTGDKTILYLNRRTSDTLECEIDTEELDKIASFDVQWFPKWSENAKTYYVCACEYLGTENGKSKHKIWYLHRFIMNAIHGEYVDHEDHNTLNNHKYNLRLSRNDENTKHRETKNSNNKSGYRNVFWSTKDERWLVVLQIDGKSKTFGRFKLEDLHIAGALAEEMRQKYYKEYAGNN